MLYNYIKALHLIFVVTWFAGLFYMPRLFMYQIQANEKPEPDRSILGKQLALMAKRLWFIITWPSAILCTVFAIALLVIMPGWLQAGWMHLKLAFVLLLFFYHGKCHLMFREMQRGEFRYSSAFMRKWNEVATLILFSVVFLVILKDNLNWIYGVLGLLGLAVLLMMGIRWYKKVQERNPEA